MISNLKRFLFILRNFSTFKFFMGFYWNGYLSEMGWIRSYETKRAMGKDNEPLPWVTYSFIAFINERLRKDFIMLEYGSGNSTLFYAHHVKKIYSIEHDEAWMKEVSARLPSNAELIYRPLENNQYARACKEIRDTFDIIMVDGRDRVNCIHQSISTLSNSGVIILDDSERPEYTNGIDHLISSGFKKIDFWGIAPGIFFNKCTTVFYRENNILKI